MRDRLVFWAKALRHGALRLNGAAGWVGSITLLLGVVAGIAVPLVYHVSHWLTAVVLLALLVIMVAEGSYSLWFDADLARARAVAERDEVRHETEHRFETQRFALDIDGIDSVTHPAPHYATGTVELGLNLANHSDEPLRYEIESIAVVMQNNQRSVEDPLLSRSGIIPPHGTALYLAPEVRGVRIPWQTGMLDVAIKYGHPSAPPRYRIVRRYRLNAFQLVDTAGQRGRINAELVSEPEVEDL